MAYRITYNLPIREHSKHRDRPSRMRLMTAAWLIVFILLTRLLFPSGTSLLRTYLLPDTHSITQLALDSFLSDLRSGEALSDAIFAFCKLIVSNDPAFSN